MSHPQNLSAIVVHESLFHNTESVGEAVARGLVLGGVSARVEPVATAPALADIRADLVVVGAPTHVFSLSSPRTREEAVSRGADAEGAGTGVREWLGAGFPTSPGHAPLAAMFDTRARKVRSVPRSAGTRGRHLLRHLGYTVIAPVESFVVEDVRGPLGDGELERAVEWGRQLARICQESAAAASDLATRPPA
jgi:hypothetical protein